MIIDIYRNNISIAQVQPLDNSQLSQKKQLEDLIRLYFCVGTYIDLRIGDYIINDKTGQKYFLKELPEVADSGLLEYECVFKSSFHNLEDTKIQLASDYNFPLTGNAKTFLQFIVENLNRNGGNYVVGKYKDTEDITVQFANWNAFESITELSNVLSFDWYLDGLILNFDAKNFETQYVLQVGQKVGFSKLTRTTVERKKIETVVYGYGSTQNLPPRTGDGLTYNSPLLTENRLFFVGVDEESKLEKNVDKFGRREQIVEFDEIKPERTGVVTAIDTEDFRVFYDTEIDFNINNQLMGGGIKPKIKFTSGILLNQEFNISYDDSAKKITLDIVNNDSGTYPNETIKPKIGAEYKLFDIIMPEIPYITDAVQLLKDTTQAYIDKNSLSMVIYEGEIDKEYIQANEIILDIGDIIRAVSGTFGIDEYYEIKALTQNITNPNIYTIQFGDALQVGLIPSLLEANFNTQQSIYNISSSSVTSNDVTNIIGDEITWDSL